jgi:tetratricopeptide (TPR) repeat protein
MDDPTQLRQQPAAAIPPGEVDRLESNLRQNPADIRAIQAFAIACDRLGDVDREASVLDSLVPAAPQQPVLLAYCAQALMQCGRYAESLARFEQALAITPNDPQIKAGYSMAVLRQGDLLRGFELYETREVLPGLREVVRQVPFPRYTKGNLHGRSILVLAEQGLGDTIMFARYLPMLARRGGTIHVAAQPTMIDLLRLIPGVSRVHRFDAQIPMCNYFTLMGSLPRLFDTTLSSIPAAVPYLRIPPARAEPFRQRVADDGASRRIGLVWSGSPTHQHDHFRSLHLSQLAPLADLNGAFFYSLQKGPRQSEALAPPAGMKLIDWAPHLNDMTDLGAAMQVMDLILTVDTAPAHLAGALARPVWTLVQHVPDWRWLLNRDDSPWYPTMRLFRESKRNDWPAVIHRVKEALQALPPRA